MKYILIFIFILSNLLAKEPPNRLGIATAISKSEYLGIATNDPIYFPMIIYNGDKFYFRALEAGYKIIDTKPFQVSAIGSVQMKNLDASDSEQLSGIKDRDRTLESGLRITLKLIPLVTINSVTKLDTLSVHKGYSSDLGIGLFLPFSKSFVMRISTKETLL